jgi:uncharacterized protein YceK
MKRLTLKKILLLMMIICSLITPISGCGTMKTANIQVEKNKIGEGVKQKKN